MRIEITVPEIFKDEDDAIRITWGGTHITVYPNEEAQNKTSYKDVIAGMKEALYILDTVTDALPDHKPEFIESYKTLIQQKIHFYETLR